MIKQLVLLLGLCVVLSYQLNDNTNETEDTSPDLISSNDVNITATCGTGVWDEILN